MQQLQSLYAAHFGGQPEAVLPLTGSGSARRYFRLSSEAGSAVGVIGSDVRENETFINLSKSFREAGCHVPEIFGVSPSKGVYLQEDLGDCQLFSLLGSEAGEEVTVRTMRALVGMQLAPGIGEEMLYPVRRMEGRHVMYDLHYFKYCFLKAVGVEPDEDALEADFRVLAQMVEETPAELTGLVLRDCQSRNIMVKGGEPWFIDYQSARRGPVMYDVASFLWQARAKFSPEFRRRMADIYMEELEKHRKVSREEMERSLQLMVWIRTLQVLGAYGLRGLTQRKAHFVESIPAALDNVAELLASPLFGELAELRRCLGKVLSMERLRATAAKDKLLTVSVFSFSYKQGYPEDLSGNGGGFMFDCRAMHNPGRYEQYKPLTGRDLPVIEFLEERGEVQQFLQGAFGLVAPAVSRYVQRGFSSLQIGFGCTGGRHRSVYCAEHLARMLRERFGAEQVRILLIHREQNIREEI